MSKEDGMLNGIMVLLGIVLVAVFLYHLHLEHGPDAEE